MADLSARPDLDHLRHQAKDLFRVAQIGDAAAVHRIRAVSERVTFASAQLAVAREYGFASWARLKVEVQRREIFDSGDVSRLRTMLAEQPELATRRMEHWCDHQRGADPLGYLAMLRFDSRRLGLPPDLPGVGAMTRVLLDAGAPVDGHPAASETPLITAASYGDAEVARILVDAGADLEATGPATGGTALHHAAVFGMTDVVDLLVAVGATIHNLVEAAAVGDVTGWLGAGTPVRERVAALRMAAGHERLAVIDQLLAIGTPVDGLDDAGSTALHEAAYSGRARSVRHLLARRADPTRRDTTFGGTPLGWCRHQRECVGESSAHDEVEAILRALESAATGTSQ
ncbi:MAG: ankyrin repeat domain-containing protein [Pseudonocardia sp.]